MTTEMTIKPAEIHFPLVQKAMEYGIAQHRRVGQMYSEFPYEYHLTMVYNKAVEYSNLLSAEDQEIVQAAAWLHDTIEDTGITYNDIKTEFGAKIADIVYNVTNEKGKNRRERALRTYLNIAACANSTFVKICDRIANQKHSKDTGGKMMWKYQEEYPIFRYALYNKAHGFNKMWDELETFNPKLYKPMPTR